MDETAPDPLQVHGHSGIALVPTLTLVYHPDTRRIGARCALEEVVVIGRGAGVMGEGVLDDDLLSRQHVAIEARGSVVSVRDLGSRNGTFVGGDRVEAATLRDGDVLAVGSLAFVVGFAPRSFAPPNDQLLAGVSFALARLIEDIRSVAREDATVLVRGETGVGKEVVARRLHELSERRGAFVAINCGGLPDGVLASELFGHVAGAFSGAGKDRTGLVEAANAGTLFLDEIGDASPQLQVSLLRLLQDREYRPVGSSQLKRSDARFTAASHVRLDAAVASGAFREDLLARLRRWVIDVPPLRTRREDIIPIALRVATEKLGTSAKIERSLGMALLLCDWPDNVRGLRAIVENACLESEGAVLSLSARVRQQLEERSAPREQLEVSNVDPAIYKKRRPDGPYLIKRLAALDGNVKELASELGVARNTLYRWLHAAGIDPGAIRPGPPVGAGAEGTKK